MLQSISQTFQYLFDQFYQMKRRNRKRDNPEFELSFIQQNKQMNAQENRLGVEILRVHTIQKQHQVDDIWRMDQPQLCKYFSSYELFPQQLDMSMSQLLQSSNLKLIKNQGKIYFGQVDRKKREGLGVNVYKQGKIYQGQFQNNQKSGQGVQIYPNGNLYIGQFLNNKKHGTGSFYWFNLSNQKEQQIQYYEGDWWGGLPDGQGKHEKINGDVFRGTFKNGLKHGEGFEYFGNGDFYKGQYINGLPEGYGQYKWNDGSNYKGDFKQGLRNGYGVWDYGKGSIEKYKGHYCLDKKSGYGVYQWQNGWTYKGNFDNDYRNGFGELYEQNQLIYKGYWDNGEQTERQVFSNNLINRTNATNQKLFMRNSKNNSKRYQTIQKYESKSKNNFNLKPKVSEQWNKSHQKSKKQFTITKRPQSYLSIGQNSERRRIPKTSRLYKNSQASSTVGSSIARPLMRGNLYVPNFNTYKK